MPHLLVTHMLFENRTAVQLQLKQEFKRNISKITPVLHGIKTYLDHPHFAPLGQLDESVEELQAVITSISSKLSLTLANREADRELSGGVLQDAQNLISCSLGVFLSQSELQR